MSSLLPLYRQEDPKTCALACLRMVLAAFGTLVTEAELLTQARMAEAGGLAIDELERLARQFELTTSVETATLEELDALLRSDRFPIVFLSRRVLEARDPRRVRSTIREAQIHCVVPARLTKEFVYFHDPLRDHPARRSRERFAEAHNYLGGTCVVCGK